MGQSINLLIAGATEFTCRLVQLLRSDPLFNILAVIHNSTIPDDVTEFAREYNIPLTTTWNRFLDTSAVDLIVDINGSHDLFYSVVKDQPVFVQKLDNNNGNSIVCMWFVHNVSSGTLKDNIARLQHLFVSHAKAPRTDSTHHHHTTNVSLAPDRPEINIHPFNPLEYVPPSPDDDSAQESLRNYDIPFEMSDDHFRLLFDQCPLPYQSLNENGDFIEVNPAWLAVMGYSRDEVIGSWFGDFLVEESRDKFKNNFETFKKIGSTSVEFNLLKKDGSVIVAVFEGKISYTPDGTFCQTHCIFVDITTRHHNEQALRESEEKYRTLVEQSIQGLSIAQGDPPKFVFVNTSLASMLGYTVDELTDGSIDPVDLIHPEFRSVLLDQYLEMLKQGTQPYCDTFKALRKDGTEIWLRKSSTCILFGGQPAVQTTFVDITNQKQMANSLRESEQRYKTIVETANEGMWITDAEGKITFTNDRFAQMIGYTADELAGRLICDFVDPEWKSHAQMYVSGKASTPAAHRDFKFTRRDGSDLWGLLSITALKNNDGSFSGTLGMVIDVTDRKKIERQLDQYRSHLEQLIDQRTSDLIKLNQFKENILATIPSSIIVLDNDLNVISYNDNFCKTFDITDSQIIGRHLCDLIDCTEQNNNQCPIVESLKKAFSGSQPNITFECVIHRKSEENIFKVRISTLSHEDQKALLVLENISQQKTMESQLVVSERLAATGRLAASIAHEINNPLQAITTHLDLIKEHLPADFPELDSYFIIKNSLAKIRDIIKQILDIYQSSRHDKTSIDINTIVHQVTSLLQNQIRIKGVNLRLDLSPQLPLILGHHQQLHQVLVNILLNAFDCTRKDDTIFIRTYATDTDIMITIRDTGSGIDPEYINHIFDPFFSIKKQSSLGLGLFVCQGLVKNHNGSISVESTPGKGSTFTISLPFEKPNNKNKH